MTKQQLVNEIKEIHVAIKSVKQDLVTVAAHNQDRAKVGEFMSMICKSVSDLANWSSRANTTKKDRLEEIRNEGLQFLAEIKALFDKELAAM